MFRIQHKRVFYPLAGFILGLLILHPYAMFVDRMIGPGTSDSMAVIETAGFFEPGMLLMGLAFGLLGGLTGLLFAVVVERGHRLILSEHEKEKREIALRTIHNLMVTLSHHLLNANMIIGGKVRRCRKIAVEQDLLEGLKLIEEQGRKIDAVLNSLRSLVEINTSGYTSDGLVSMIDISRELDEQLDNNESRRSGSGLH